MSRLDRILLTASLLGLLPTGLILPFYAIFVKNIGGDLLDVGIAFGLFSISSGILVLAVTKTNLFKMHLRQMAIIGYALVAIGQATYFFIDTPLQLFLTQILIGIATGILDPAWDSLYSIHKDEERAVHSWSLWSAGQRITTGTGAILGAFIIGYYSFTVLFAGMLLCNLLAFGVSLRLLWKQNERIK